MDPIGTSAKYAPAASVGSADDSDSAGALGSGTTGAAVSVVTFAAATPRSVRVSEAPSYGQTVMTYDPASAGALSYLEAAREIASKGAPPA